MDQEMKTKFKLRCVLFELLKSDYKVTDDTILEKLISHLSDKNKGSQLIDVPLCTAWARSAVTSWQQGKTPPAIASFAFRLIGIIVEDENNFVNIQNAVSQLNNTTPGFISECETGNCHFLQVLREICLTASRSVSNFSVKCAVIQFLSSLLKHSSGQQWLLSRGLWKEVHEMSLTDCSVYVVREARKFLSSLLNSLPASQEKDVETVVSVILDPFYSASTSAELTSDNPKVTATLYLILDILESAFLTSDPETRKIKSPVFEVVSKPHVNLLLKCLEALKASKSEELEELLSKIAVLIYILDTIKDGQRHETPEMKAICLQILDVFNELINKGNVENVLKLCVLCHNHWTYVAKIQRRTTEEENNYSVKGVEDEKRYRFEDQLLCLQERLHFWLAQSARSVLHLSSILTPFGCVQMCWCKYASVWLYYFLSTRVLHNHTFTFSCFLILKLISCFKFQLYKHSVAMQLSSGHQSLPMYVGISGGSECDILAEISETFIIKLTSLIHNRVTRMVYTFRSLIIERGSDERLALLSVSSIGQIKHVLNRLTPLCVGCTMGDSTLESYFQIQISQRLEMNVMRSIYTLRDSVVKNRHIMDRSALLSVASICSLSARDIDPEDERERAVLVFQSFIYVLKHFVLCAESETKQGGWGGEFRQSHHSTLLVAILDGLANLVRSHRITWRESVESLCLLTLAQELLNSPTFSSKVKLVVQALHLIQLCIENFMPPNLALLTNTISGTSLDQLGPLIHKRLHDPNWEVRDSALEVLLTLATISHTKYPLFQEVILDNKFCEVVVHLALNDAESYVCASATKCLTAMVRVDRLWNEELCDKDLVNKMIGILNGESEGVLRREASLLISQIFKFRKVQPDVLKKMCLTMANVVLSDLHWEVKVNALTFWELIIVHQMNDQGMIDGVFPQVTFSKEHRKIITLTPSAIQERLKKVLSELSQNGCLHVLLESIQKDEDLQVVKKAAEIIMSLRVVLERHDLLGPKNITASISTPSYSSGSSPASNSNSVLSSCDRSDTGNSLSENEIQNRNSGSYGILNAEHFTELNYNLSESLSGKSILDLDPQEMGFAVLDHDGLDLPSMTPRESQDEVIDSILNDRDINLLAKVYLGTGAEVPGRQGPETKISKPLHPLVVLSPDDFLQALSTVQVDKIVEERTRWIEDTGGNLDTLLDDMLITREITFEKDDDDCNAMDCY